MNTNEDATITGDLCLGKYPLSFARLPRVLESMPRWQADAVVLNSSWFDLTMLGYLAILLRSCKKPEASLTLRFGTDRKYSFLWRSGFFSASRVGHRNSPFNVEPDIWNRQPSETKCRANFTPFIVLDMDAEHPAATEPHGYSELAKNAAYSLLSELEKTYVYPLVEHSELMESREYLHVVLWELVQNVIDHAKASHAVIAAQVFYKGDCKGDEALSGLPAQHFLEEQHCVLPLRENWLFQNREHDYLMLTCVDNGVGIPASVRRKKSPRTEHDDRQLLGSSFQRELSDHDSFEHRYAIHGLHLIAQLISSYHGYLFAQSGAAFVEAAQHLGSPSTISKELALPGAAFQLLLPLTASEPRPYVEPHGVRPRGRAGLKVIYATEELRKKTFRLPPSQEDQPSAVDGLVRMASHTSGALFLDFVGMPRERRFTSLLLLCVRRKKTDHPVIVLNASEELFTAVRGLRTATDGTPHSGELGETDRALATDLTRGEAPALLPLIVAVTRLRDAGRFRIDDKSSQPGIAVQWLGIADDGPRGLESCLVTLLDELFRAEGAVDELLLEDLLIRAGKPEGTAKYLLRNIQRANQNLLSYFPGTPKWYLAFDRDNLYFDSVEALITRLRDANDGLRGLESCLATLLDELFRAEDTVDESLLEDLLIRAGKAKGTARHLLQDIQRADQDLLSYLPGTPKWRLAFNGNSLYFDSVESLTQRLRDAVHSAARFDVPAGTLFFLNWRPADEAYLRNYYMLWRVVRDPEVACIAATLLLRMAHDDANIGPEIPRLGALVSVTASAGQVAREIARILRISHWEAASVYDLGRAEWPRDFASEPVLIIDDLIDTGTASRMVIDELVLRRNARCVGVLSVLASIEGDAIRQSLATPIVSIMGVELGRPTLEEITRAEQNDTVWDVDPNTLEPMPRKRFATAISKTDHTTKDDLSLLARYRGLRSGHFVYGGHHYYEFFDIVRFMEVREGFDELWTWFRSSVTQWHSRTVVPIAGKNAPVVIIYPYYSPIAAFLHRIQTLLPDSFRFPCTIHVACPYQRSKQRLGYRLDSLSANDRFAVFIDDGIASGGTLSEVVDEFVALHNPGDLKPTRPARRRPNGTTAARAAILALPVFDRIGMNPRKHLKSVQWYHGAVRFEFEPRYSLNLRAYYAKDCPLCRIDTDIDSTFRTYGHLRQHLEHDLTPVRELLSPTYLTPVASCATAKEMNLLNRDDTATVVHASDALFSDLASGSDIKRSIRNDPNKSGMARLEILLNVMMDPILYRSVHEETFFTDTITHELWGEEVLSNYRSYFVMHMPYLYSEELARRILLDVVPRSLRASPEPIHDQTPAGISPQTPTRYFDNHPEFFTCILTAIWILRKRVSLPEGWDAEWRQTLRGTPYGHQFVCGTSLTKEDVARACAEMLLCNFVTHYKDHREAFPKRLEDLRNLIDAGRRTSAVPRHALTYLVNAIEIVRDYYDLEDGVLSPDITADILHLHEAWLAGDDPAGRRLRTLLVQHFAPEQTIYDATITRQLRDGLAPTTDDVITQAKDHFAEWLLEQSRTTLSFPEGDDQVSQVERVVSSLVDETVFHNEASGIRVFGNTHFIVRALTHLLRNPFESGMGRGTPLPLVKPTIVLDVTKTRYNARDVIRFAVTSAEKLTQEEIDRCFRAGGGLMAQKQVIERWGGKMAGYASDDGRTAFFIDLETVSMARKASV